MTTIRAKFKVTRIERSEMMRDLGKKSDAGLPIYENVEVNTVVMSPVYAGSDSEHENRKFWEATPSGEIKLGVVNAEAVKSLELGKEVYVDFTLAE